MLNLSRQDKDLLLEIAREALAEEPAELEVFSVTGEEVLREAASRKGMSGADSDAFFGGLDHSLGELLMHLLVLAAAEAIKHSWVLSRKRIREILEQRRQRGAAESPELAHAGELLILCLVRETGEPAQEAGLD